MSKNHHFTFLRHGESVGNRDHLVQGQHNFPLSPTGIEQAKELASRWKAEGREFDSIISSPLSRALESAEIIQKEINCPLTVEPLWMERHRGKIQGMSRDEARQQINEKDLHQLYLADPNLGEGDWELSMRSGRALQSLFSRPPGKYLVVTHGGILNKALHNIFGIKTDNSHGGLYFSLSNTSYTEITYNLERDQWAMETYRQTPNKPAYQDPPSNLYRFVFIRHAESEGNIRKEFQGQTDTPLTERGVTQTRQIGGILQKIGYQFDQIISSPQDRAALTAKQIAAGYSLELEFDPRLKEVANGALAGLTLEESEERAIPRPDRHNPYYPIGGTGESWFELFLRAGEFLNDLMKRAPGTYAIVSHGALLNSLLRAIMGTIPQPSKQPGLFYFKNTGYAELTYSPTKNLWGFHSLRAPNHEEEYEG